MTRRASCCCGACSVELEGDPVLNGICHCRNCKRRTGSAFGWSAYLADERVLARSGDFGVYAIAGANPQRRWFCAACGTTLIWKVEIWSSRTGVAGGCFADPPLPEPTVTVSNNGRCTWLGLPADWQTSI
jgi:hypothetical protein